MIGLSRFWDICDSSQIEDVGYKSRFERRTDDGNEERGDSKRKAFIGFWVQVYMMERGSY